jgi:hypothetical protein
MSARTKPTPAAAGQSETRTLEYPYTTFEGEHRKVLVAVDAIEETGVWSVYDMPAGRDAKVGWLVERLAAHDEKLDEAVFLAVAYHADQVAYQAGERGEQVSPDPLPKPTETPAGEIRKHAALARRLAAALQEPTAVAA